MKADERVNHKTTPNQYSEFKKEFVKWAKLFGLHRLEFFFCHENSHDGNALAWCCYAPIGQIATVGLAVDWDDLQPTLEAVKRAAFHECMESFLYHARSVAESRFVTGAEIDAEWHRVIRTLETVIYDKGQVVAVEATPMNLQNIGKGEVR